MVASVRRVTQWEWNAVLKEIVHSNRWTEFEPNHYQTRDGESVILHTQDVEGFGNEVVAIDMWQNDDSLLPNRLVLQEGG